MPAPPSEKLQEFYYLGTSSIPAFWARSGSTQVKTGRRLSPTITECCRCLGELRGCAAEAGRQALPPAAVPPGWTCGVVARVSRRDHLLRHGHRYCSRSAELVSPTVTLCLRQAAG